MTGEFCSCWKEVSIMAGAFDIVMGERKNLVGEIINMMQQGDFFRNAAEWNAAALSPQNPLSNVRYKGGNRLRLMAHVVMNHYKDPRWATAKQYMEKGYHIRKGEHGVICEKWIFEKKQKTTDIHGNVTYELVPLEHPQVSYFRVFNAEQIDGFPAFEKDQQNLTDVSIMGDRLMETSECPVELLAQERAYYSPAADKIILPLRSQFKDEESFVKTLLHEMSHSSGAKGRLNRDMSGMFGTESYAREELRAEIGSLFTGYDLGLQLASEHYEDHSDYLKSWIGVLQDDYNELFRACADAEKISERLIGNYCKKYELENRTIGGIPDKKESDGIREMEMIKSL